ncbi:MAG: transglycosylase domain-containing protein [Brucellaceae bacterium]|nr:transglycosylase domain-containing protein [Brucellaceae bacterium]
MNEIKTQGQQYFPTYDLSHDATQVAIKEYELSSATLAAEEKILTLSTSFLVAFIGVTLAFFNGKTKEFVDSYGKEINSPEILILFLLVTSLLTFCMASYFADARRSVVNASRKIIILRRMLGLSYGAVELVLPSNRLEGANEPYHIKMFHGWRSPKAIPIYCIAFSTSIIFFLVYPWFSQHFPRFDKDSYLFGYGKFIIPIIWFFVVIVFYRIHLCDQYENIIRLFGILVAFFIRQPTVDNIEYTIYRARLAVIEAIRLQIPVHNFHAILIGLEDRDFRSHKGVSLKAMFAALNRYLRRGKRSGGSTITQQIVRTLFIRDLKNNFRRKLVEIILALWFDRMFSKDELANLYICCVRYERKIDGVAEAINYFFPNTSSKNLSKAKIFFLVERVANIRSKMIVDKISENLKYLYAEKLLNKVDVLEVLEIFSQQIEAQRVKSDKEELEKLKGNLRVILQ